MGGVSLIIYDNWVFAISSTKGAKLIFVMIMIEIYPTEFGSQERTISLDPSLRQTFLEERPMILLSGNRTTLTPLAVPISPSAFSGRQERLLQLSFIQVTAPHIPCSAHLRGLNFDLGWCRLFSQLRHYHRPIVQTVQSPVISAVFLKSQGSSWIQ